MNVPDLGLLSDFEPVLRAVADVREPLADVAAAGTGVLGPVLGVFARVSMRACWIALTRAMCSSAVSSSVVSPSSALSNCQQVYH